MTFSVVGLNASEQATSVAAATRLEIDLIADPPDWLPRRQGKTKSARIARPRALNVIIAILQDVPAEILVFHDSQQPLPDGGSVEHDVLDGIIGQLEEHFLEQRAEHRVQPPGPDVLHALVHLGGDTRALFDASGGELARRTIGHTEAGGPCGARVAGLRP